MMKKIKPIVCSVVAGLLLLGGSASAATTIENDTYVLSYDKQYVYAMPDGKSVNALYDNVDKVVLIKSSKTGNILKTTDTAVTGNYLIFADGSERTLAVIGDIDANGKAEAADKALMAKHIKEQSALKNAALKAADIDSNGYITSTDYQLIRQHILSGKLITKQIGDPTPVNTDWANRGYIKLSDGGITVQGSGVTVSGNTVTITAGGDYAVTGECTNGMIRVNCDAKVKLRLSGVQLTNKNGPAIFFEKTQKSYITVSTGTENTLTDGSSYSVAAKGTVFSNSDLEIKGGGKLTVTANYRHGIACDDALSIENGTITVLKSVKDAINVNDAIEVIGGTVNVENCGSDAFDCGGTISISGGTLNLKAPSGDAIKALSNIVVTAGKINVLNADNGIKTDAVFSAKGGEFDLNCFGNGIKAITSINIEGGKYKIVAKQEGIEGGTSSIANNSAQVTVKNGEFDITATGYAISSTGKVNLSGGKFDLHGGTSKIYAKSSVTTNGAEIIG